MLWALPLLAVAAALVSPAVVRRPRTGTALALAVAGATLALAAWAAIEAPSASWRWGAGLELKIAASGFARTMVLLVPLVAAPVLAYAAVTEHEGRARLLALMSAFVGAMLLLVLAADLLTLLVAWELVGALSWALIAHGWRDASNVGAATRAFVTTRIGDLGLFGAAGIAFASTGSFAFADLTAAGGWHLEAIAFGVLLAAAAKSAQAPFSPWLFAAMAGPTPVSALLHSATLVAAGAYILVRTGGYFDAVEWFGPAVVTVGLITALAGGVVALVQTEAKRLLAASTSAQYGLMFVAVGAGATAAAGAHLVAHTFVKSLLFLGAGVAIHAAGSGRLECMRLGRALPHAAVLTAVGAAALAGLPPLGAAWTKGAIVAAGFHASAGVGAGVLLASLLTALYAGRYYLLAYGQDPRGEAVRAKPSRVELGAMAVLAAASVALAALWLPPAERLVERATAGDLAGGAAWELLAEVLVLLAAGVGLWWLVRRGRLSGLGMPSGVRVHAADWLGLPAATNALAVAPVLLSSRALARLDDRVIDAGVRGVGALARLLARLFALRIEWTFDGVVRLVTLATWRAALVSRVSDERAIDEAVERTARAVDEGGARSRRLQTGLAHHYYLIVGGGLLAGAALVAALSA